MVVPQQRLRRELGRRLHAARDRDVPRLRKVVRERVPRRVGGLRRPPAREQDGTREREPRGLDEAPRTRLTEARGEPAPHPRDEPGQAPRPREDERRRHRRQDARGQQPGLRQREDEEPRRDDAGGEGRDDVGEVPGFGLRLAAEEEAREEIAQEQRAREHSRRREQRRRVSGEDGDDEPEPHETRGGRARKPPDPQGQDHERREAGRGGQGERRRRVETPQLDDVGPRERCRTGDQENGRGDDEGGAPAWTRALGRNLLHGSSDARPRYRFLRGTRK